jgi:rhamnose transport system ATP-binding protein
MSLHQPPLLRVTDLLKDHGALRPLRLRSLELCPGARLAIVGLDAVSAEVLVNLLTGATLADEGTVEVFGRATSSITVADDWLATLDRFGVISVRAVLLEPFTVAQNLAMAFTLSVDPIPGDVAAKVDALAAQAGLSPGDLAIPFGSAPPAIRARCHLGRALAPSPEILVLEHANALVPAGDADAFGRDIVRAAESLGAALLALTADERFARAVAADVYRHDPGSGRLAPITGWRRFFS